MLKEIFFGFSLLILVSTTKFNDCGSMGNIELFEFPGCEEPPCNVTLGSQISVIYGLSLDKPTRNLRLHITYYSAVYHKNFKLTFDGLCEELDQGNCSITHNSIQFTISSDIPEQLPVRVYPIRANLTNDNNDTVMCAEFSVQIA